MEPASSSSSPERRWRQRSREPQAPSLGVPTSWRRQPDLEQRQPAVPGQSSFARVLSSGPSRTVEKSGRDARWARSLSAEGTVRQSTSPWWSTGETPRSPVLAPARRRPASALLRLAAEDPGISPVIRKLIEAQKAEPEAAEEMLLDAAAEGAAAAAEANAVRGSAVWEALVQQSRLEQPELHPLEGEPTGFVLPLEDLAGPEELGVGSSGSESPTFSCERGDNTGCKVQYFKGREAARCDGRVRANGGVNVANQAAVFRSLPSAHLAALRFHQ